MPPRRTRNINDVYERIMARMDERLDQFVDQFSNRMNDMMNPNKDVVIVTVVNKQAKRYGNPFFEGDCSSSNEMGDPHGVASDDMKGVPIILMMIQFVLSRFFHYISWYQEPKFLIKMPPRRTRNINDVYERIMARMDERLDQFVDQFSNRMNDMMNLRRCGDRNGRRSEDEELGNPFFEGDCSSSNEWGDHGVAGDDYEGAPVFDDGYEEAPIFDDDQFEEESMPVYDTDIEDVIGEEEENMEDIVVVANDLCSSMIQTTLSVDFSKNINSNPHELIWSQKGNLVELLLCSWRFAKILLIIGIRLNQRLLEFPDYRWYQEPKFLIKMPPRRTRNINDVYERIMARMDERLDQFVDQFSNRMNDMMNLRRCGDRNGRRSEDEELGNPFFEGDCSSSNELGDHGVAGDDYERASVFDDGYEEAPIFDDDQFEEESMPVYDTDIEDVIGEEEENMEDIVVVANDLCSSMIQTTLSVDFSKNINSNPHELIWSQKGEELEYQFFEGDGSSSDEWRDYGMGGDDYEGPPIFDDDQYEEESMPVYDTDIEDVIEEKEGFIEK
ncbi:hypothetical protein Tco_1459119 [Tanacetum coccineum]